MTSTQRMASESPYRKIQSPHMESDNYMKLQVLNELLIFKSPSRQIFHVLIRDRKYHNILFILMLYRRLSFGAILDISGGDSRRQYVVGTRVVS